MIQISTASLAIGVLTATAAEVRVVSMMTVGVSMAPVVAAVLAMTSVLAEVSTGVTAVSVKVEAT